MTRTGEIGMVKLLSVVKFREGVRMEMLSGKRVLDYLNMVNEQNRQISVKLSAKMDKTASAVARLQVKICSEGKSTCVRRRIYRWRSC